MKNLLITLSVLFVALQTMAQSVTITIVASSDGVTSTTNVVNVPAVRVQGLIASWNDDSKNKTNANPPVAALTLSQFIVQEFRDQGVQYANRGATLDMLNWGITNPPAKLVELWPTFDLNQKTNALNYHKAVGN